VRLLPAEKMLRVAIVQVRRQFVVLSSAVSDN
jgi:hypothetical protein